MKEPIEYLEKVKVGFSSTDKYGTFVSLESDAICATFHTDSEVWDYHTTGWNDLEKGQDSGLTDIVHYFSKGQDDKLTDEIVALAYTTSGGYGEHPGDIDLRISLKSGLAWRTYCEKDAIPATDKQIETMITHLKRSIERAKQTVADYMVDTTTSPKESV